MKVSGITFGTNSAQTVKKTLPEEHHPRQLSEFAYLPRAHKDEELNSSRLKRFLGICAAAAVLITLLRIKGRKKLPETITDLTDKTLGLNKIQFKRTAQELKNGFLYPLKAHLEGDKSIIKNKKLFKPGLILADSDVSSAKGVIDAFYEHANNLGIRCKRISECTSRTKEGKKKWVQDTIKEAQENFKKDGKLTLIDIGNMDNLINLQIHKKRNSNLENTLIEISKKSYSGVVWTSYTNRTRQIPMYYNNLPVLVTKLMD